MTLKETLGIVGETLARLIADRFTGAITFTLHFGQGTPGKIEIRQEWNVTRRGVDK